MQLYIKYTLSTEGLGTECLNRLYRKSPRKPLELDCIKQSTEGNSLTHCCAWPAEGRSVLHIERSTEGKVNVNAYNNKNNKKLSYG